ncbi:hypothetical protein KAJ27_24355 [bacterium]|nr:hypothetical protein [bacterium]
MKKEYFNNILSKNLWSTLKFPFILSGIQSELTEFVEERIIVSQKTDSEEKVIFHGDSLHNEMDRFIDLFSPSLFSSSNKTIIIRDFHKIKTPARKNVVKILKSSINDLDKKLIIHQNPMKSTKALDNFSAIGTRIECYPPSAEEIMNYIKFFLKFKHSNEVLFEIMEDFSDNLGILTRELDKIQTFCTIEGRAIKLKEYNQIKFSGFSKNIFDIFPLIIKKDFSTIMRIIEEEETHGGNKMLLGYLTNFSLNVLKMKIVKMDNINVVKEIEKISRQYILDSKNPKMKWTFLKNKKSIENQLKKLCKNLYETIPEYKKNVFKIIDPDLFQKNKNQLIGVSNVSSFLSFREILIFLTNLYQANYDIRNDRIPLLSAIRSIFINTLN